MIWIQGTSGLLKKQFSRLRLLLFYRQWFTELCVGPGWADLVSLSCLPAFHSFHPNHIVLPSLLQAKLFPLPAPLYCLCLFLGSSFIGLSAKPPSFPGNWKKSKDLKNEYCFKNMIFLNGKNKINKFKLSICKTQHMPTPLTAKFKY